MIETKAQVMHFVRSGVRLPVLKCGNSELTAVDSVRYFHTVWEYGRCSGADCPFFSWGLCCMRKFVSEHQLVERQQQTLSWLTKAHVIQVCMGIKFGELVT